ncbi:MAG: hypothetical protein J5715_05850 [Clostridiales bacterium]|nr:hypothetical protein [Clostridiales bacterium]
MRRSVEPKYSMCVQPAFIIGTNNEDGMTFGVSRGEVLDPVIYSGRYHSLDKMLGEIGDFLN